MERTGPFLTRIHRQKLGRSGADEQGGWEMFLFCKSQTVPLSSKGRVTTLAGHSMCTLAAILVNETMAL